MIQLSLFTESTEDRSEAEAGAAVLGEEKASRRSAKPSVKNALVRRETVPDPGSVKRERRRAETLTLPFDDSPDVDAALNSRKEAELPSLPVAVTPPPAPPIAVILSQPAPPVVADLFSLLEEEDAAPKRIAFDPQVWLLRPDSGDFIHIRTGEVREEDEFLAVEPDEAPEVFSDWAGD